MPDNDTLQINHKKQNNISEDIFKRKPTSKFLLDRLPGKSSHVSFYTATLEMMIKGWALVITPSFLAMKHPASPHQSR